MGEEVGQEGGGEEEESKQRWVYFPSFEKAQSKEKGWMEELKGEEKKMKKKT